MSKSPKIKKSEKPADAAIAIEPATAVTTKTPGKVDQLVSLMRRAEGAELEELMAATGWQAHSVRGAISGAVKRKLGLQVSSLKEGDMRVYRIVSVVGA